MTTREEWLIGCVGYVQRHRDFRSRHALTGRRIPTLLSSFPAKARRKPTVGELVRDDEGNTLALVSPVLSSSLEVTVVAWWLTARYQQGLIDPRTLTTRRGSDRLTRAGFRAPFTSCVPTDDLVSSLESLVTNWVDSWGEYPAADVNLPTRATQTTRMLKYVCNGGGFNDHADYIVRISQSQVQRGRPGCGICGREMHAA